MSGSTPFQLRIRPLTEARDRWEVVATRPDDTEFQCGHVHRRYLASLRCKERWRRRLDREHRQAAVAALRADHPEAERGRTRRLASGVPAPANVITAGIEIVCVPSFVEVEIGGEERTGIRLMVTTRG